MVEGINFNELGVIKVNNVLYWIILKNKNIESIDLYDKDLQLNMEVQQSTLVENALIGCIVSALRHEISKGKDLESLKQSVIEVNRYINTHPELLKNINELRGKDEIANKTMTSLIAYFDDVLSKQKAIDFDSVTSFEVNGQEYIKHKAQDGNVKILEDNSKLNFMEQLNNKQEESTVYQTNNDVLNTEIMINNMEKFEKQDVDFEEFKDMNSVQASAMESYSNTTGNEIVGDEATGIYYDKTDDKLLTPEVVGNNIEINEVKETEVSKNDGQPYVSYPAYDEELVTNILVNGKGSNSFNIEAFINNYLPNLSINQINFILSNYKLDEAMIIKLKEQLNSKQELVPDNPATIEKPKTKVLTLDKKAAFIDTLLLTFIVGSLSGIYLTYLIFGIMS